MDCEVESFIVKFRNLWKAGRNVNLIIEANAGKAAVSLRVADLEGPPQVPGQFFCPPRRSRNGPAQQRRREKRAAARNATEEAATIEAEKATNVVIDKDAVKATESIVTIETNAEEAPINKVAENVADEFCSDASYGSENLEANKVTEENQGESLFKIVGKYKDPKAKP